MEAARSCAAALGPGARERLLTSHRRLWSSCHFVHVLRVRDRFLWNRPCLQLPATSLPLVSLMLHAQKSASYGEIGVAHSERAEAVQKICHGTRCPLQASNTARLQPWLLGVAVGRTLTSGCTTLTDGFRAGICSCGLQRGVEKSIHLCKSRPGGAAVTRISVPGPRKKGTKGLAEVVVGIVATCLVRDVQGVKTWQLCEEVECVQAVIN